ncbi:MAG: EutN/CcmL family microcompartment protein [Polyangiaceae bacterium]|nr:EutN/CcmL family microcompartment protein [Polyangiaceae bacterium]
MRLGVVVGRVTLNQVTPALRGGRWLIVSPFTHRHMQAGSSAPAGLSPDPTLVVYDDIGAGPGNTIGFVEGREAAVPLVAPAPIDALHVAMVDEIHHCPL